MSDMSDPLADMSDISSDTWADTMSDPLADIVSDTAEVLADAEAACLGCMVPWLRPAAHGARYAYVLGLPWQAYDYGRPLITVPKLRESLLACRQHRTRSPRRRGTATAIATPGRRRGVGDGPRALDTRAHHR